MLQQIQKYIEKVNYLKIDFKIYGFIIYKILNVICDKMYIFLTIKSKKAITILKFVLQLEIDI